MKHLLITTIAAVVLVGCGESQQSVPPAETEPAEPVAEAAKPELPTAKVPYISIHTAAGLRFSQFFNTAKPTSQHPQTRIKGIIQP